MAHEMEKLQKLFETTRAKILVFKGSCHDCGKNTTVEAQMEADGKTVIDGGAVYIHGTGMDQQSYVKCDPCFKRDPVLRNYQECEVYSTIVGYLRPIKQWNPGKQAEFEMRKNFVGPKEEKENGK